MSRQIDADIAAKKIVAGAFALAEAQDAARHLLALAQFPTPYERNRFLDAHPFLKEPRHVFDEEEQP